MLVEAVDSRTGALKSEIQVSQRHAPTTNQGMTGLFGDYLVAYGAYNNSVIYHLSDGRRIGAFFGHAIAGDSKLGLIAATNRDQEVTLYEAETGKELKRVTVDEQVRAARFIPSLNALLVLTGNQRVYTIDLPSAAKMQAAGK